VRDASGWTIDTAVMSDTAVMTAIDCPDTWHCLAVAGRTAWARRAAAWSQLDPGSTTTWLYGVACVSAVDCGVGGARGGAAAMLRRENETWSSDSVAQPTVNYGAALYAVACAGHACQAVGYTGVPLLRRGQGTSWLPVRAAAVVGPRGHELNAVSCGGASRCLAVGWADGPYGQEPYAATWTGTRWTDVPGTAAIAPPIKEEFGFLPPSFLTAVSCAAATSCVAVGWADYGDGETQPFAGQWNGTRWTALHIALPDGLYAPLGVACTSTADCTAVGTGTRIVVERWNGSTWRNEGANLKSGVSMLTSITCRSASNCTAVGAWGFPLAAHRTGDAWSFEPGPSSPSGARASGVACPSSTSCIAVGFTDDDYESPMLALAARWNGRRWLTTPLPSPSHGGPVALYAASCPSTTTCWAVGEAYGANAAPIVRWDGTNWSNASAPAPADTGRLFGVSCEPGRPCFAVGDTIVQYH
jgi:hypothetical protein